MTKLVYIDVETSGLSPRTHQVWEIAYAIGDGPIRSSFVEHTLHNADAAALTINRYYDRVDGVPSPTAVSEMRRFEDELRRELFGATLVGANPAFDAAMMFARWGVAPWHYRVLDVETLAMPALGLSTPRGLAYLCEMFGVAPADHAAAGDVRAVREVHTALVEHYAGVHDAYRLPAGATA